jgi:hypothetical protein
LSARLLHILPSSLLFVLGCCLCLGHLPYASDQDRLQGCT